jgi:hypothetical protein
MSGLAFLHAGRGGSGYCALSGKAGRELQQACRLPLHIYKHLSLPLRLPLRPKRQAASGKRAVASDHNPGSREASRARKIGNSQTVPPAAVAGASHNRPDQTMSYALPAMSLANDS